MASLEAVEVSPSHIRYVVGYALTSMWATMLLFSSRFAVADSTSIVTLSMLCGVVACIVVLATRTAFPRHCGRTPLICACAAGMAVGTLLCTLPAFSANLALNAAGIALSGLCALPLLLAWFTEYSRLPSRTIVLLASFALLLAALLCFALSECPRALASALIGISPLVSFALLPAKAPRSAKDAPACTANRPLPSLTRMLTQAVSWRTLLGIVIVFFVMGSLGVASPRVDLFRNELSPALLLYPAAIACLFAASALFARKRIDAAIMYKVLLMALAGLLFALVFLGRASASYIFYSYITCDVLLWTVLALASKSTPVEPFAVFIIGWLAECLGNVVGHNAAVLMADTSLFAAITGLLIFVAIGFAFSEGLFVLDLDDDEAANAQASRGDLEGGTRAPVAPEEAPADGQAPHAGSQAAARSGAADATADGIGARQEAAAGESAGELAGRDPQGATGPDPMAAFVEAHGLSRREAEVFALWVTGHGLKYIQETLFISESTAKTHMRNIYRKCDVHNRAEIIDLYERESS